MRNKVLLPLAFIGALGFASTACAPDEGFDLSDSEDSLLDEGDDDEPRVLALGKDLWPGGVVHYAFDDGSVSGRPMIQPNDQSRVVDRMEEWEDAMTTGYGGFDVTYIDFRPCVPGSTCPDEYLQIRYNQAGESGMACNIGRETPEVVDTLVMRIAMNTIDDSTLLHELGHCLGTWHEHERQDRSRWLINENHTLPTRTELQLPLLGNYDYDSVMHYASRTSSNGTSGTIRFEDRHNNRFSRWTSSAISAGDVSRMMQYYAHEYENNWDFFRSLSTLPGSQHTLPDPYLAPGVHAVGTPAITELDGEPLIVVRGSNDSMYWKTGTSPGGWTSMGCCAGTDPAIVTRASGHAVVTFVGAHSGRVIYSHFNNGSWGSWWYVPDGGEPRGGVGTYFGARIGPGIASRRTWWFDVFAVQANGRLAVISYMGGGNWTDWTTLGSSYYDVDVRPAAVALDSNTVQLATVDNTRLYEPTVNFNGGAVTGFATGPNTARVSNATAPGLTKRNSSSSPYRVLMVNEEGRLSHRFSGQSYWRDIGGIPHDGTGVSAVATGSFSADIIMNGEDVRGCDMNCIPGQSPSPGDVVQPSGLWLRHFH